MPTPKQLIQDIKDFIIYVSTEPFLQVIVLLRDIWNIITKKKVLFYIWFIVFAVSAFLKNNTAMYFSLAMCVAFFVAYHWQVGEFRAKARQKYKKRLFKNKKGK